MVEDDDEDDEDDEVVDDADDEEGTLGANSFTALDILTVSLKDEDEGTGAAVADSSEIVSVEGISTWSPRTALSL